MTEYVHVGSHADVLESGAGIGPGDRVKGSELGELDQHLIDAGTLADVSTFEGEDNRQTKPDLQARAAELGIEGRSKLTVDELRAAIAERENATTEGGDL